MKFIIDRKTWLRGEGTEASKLLRPEDGKMCCMGQIASACGVPDEMIRGKVGVAVAAQIYPEAQEKLKPFLDHGAYDIKAKKFVLDAYAINDDRNLLYDDAKRERKLSELFAANGHELEFIN